MRRAEEPVHEREAVEQVDWSPIHIDNFARMVCFRLIEQGPEREGGASHVRIAAPVFMVAVEPLRKPAAVVDGRMARTNW